jgi:emp24/gp25L/p24 family/GOLD
MLPRRNLTAIVLLTAICTHVAHGLRFYIKDRERICFYVPARYQERLQGEATLENGKGTARLNVEITTEDGHVLFDRHDAKIGAFSVVTPPSQNQHAPVNAYNDNVEDYDDGYQPHDAERKYKACLLLTVDPDPALQTRVQRAVTFKLRPADRGDSITGPGGKHADSEKVDTMAFALDAMLSQLHGMSQDLSDLQARERSLVTHNQSTATRLSQFTIISLVVLVATASFQYSHYKSFFTSKKLC